MGNNVNICGIVAISEEGHIISSNLKQNLNARHYDEPTILSHPFFQNNYTIENNDTIPFEYRLMMNKETEIDGEEDKNHRLRSKSLNSSKIQKRHLREVGSILFSNKNSLYNLL